MTQNRTVFRRILHVVLAVCAILLVPWLAMRFSDQVVWTVSDFIVAGMLLVGTGILYQLAVTNAGSAVYRVAAGVALGAALFLVWVNLAVGIIGTEADRANLMYVGVLAVGLAGAVAARLRPRGMARALFATALAQAVVTVIALTLRLGDPWSPPTELLLVNGMFVALFVGSGLLFRQAARDQTSSGREVER